MPHTLSGALDAVLDGLPADPLRRATASLIDAYRSGAPPTAQVLRDPTTAAAYAAYRMPATHAAVSRALRHATDLAPDLDVRTLVDVGGGTGAATWAVAEAFPRLERATVLDGSADALALGARIGRHGPPPVADATWSRALLGPGVTLPGADLVVVSYVLGELAEWLHAPVVDAAVASAAQLVLVVEPGTPRGYAAVLAARSRLTDAGWHLLAPCPQDGACPVATRSGRLVPLRGAAGPQRPAPAGQGRPARPRGREVLLRAGVARARDAGRGSGAAASGHPKGPRAAGGLRLRGVRGASRGDQTRPDRLPCGTRRLVGRYVVRPRPLLASTRSITSIKGVT